MLVQRSIYDEAVEIAAAKAASTKVDLPSNEGKHIGPLVSEAQFEKVQSLFKQGLMRAHG